MPEITDDIHQLLPACMLIDQARLRRRLRGAARLADPMRATAALQEIRHAVNRSIERRQRRLEALPAPRFPDNLPITGHRDRLARAITDHQVVIVCGETGSGKTTQIPKICLDLGRGVAGMIGHTQPRRLAARSVAARIAQELGSSLGQIVGFKVRFQDRVSADSLVKLMTDGILLAETAADRDLIFYDTLIIDEAHERSLNIDFLLGYIRQLLPRRPDLKVIITSATIDPARFSRHFNQAPVIEIPGRTFPVDVRYRPVIAEENDEDDPTVLDGILRAVNELLDAEQAGKPGDILVFLSGEREIRETAEALEARRLSATEVLPLYARLSTDEQNRVFEPHDGRRIILATNVAETSLTVPGIRGVIDPGLARVSRYSPHARVQRLPIEPISQASAEQRKGRCGRVGPGICIRLYSEEDLSLRPAFSEPEIQRANLASVILQMKALRLGAVERFGFIDPPRPASVREGYQTLQELGALDPAGDLTPLGASLAKLPVDPRLGRMIIEADREGSLREVLIITAALATQDPRLRPLDQAALADAQHARFIDDRSDFLSLLKLWDFWRESATAHSGNRLRRICSQQFLSFVRFREWSDVHTQLEAQAHEAGLKSNPLPASYESTHRALLSGLLGNIGMRNDAHAYQGVRDRTFSIFPGSSLFKSGPRWIMAAELVETTRLYGRTVARIQPEWVERLAGPLLKRTHTPPHWNARSAHVEAFEKLTLHGLTVIPKRRVHFGRIDPELAREIFIQHALVEGDYQPPGGEPAFARHNREVIAEVRAMEAKSRRRDIIAPDAVVSFYAQRIPFDVCNGPQFEKWRRQAERANPQLLMMHREDLLRQDASIVAAEQFPDHLEMESGLQLPLSYELDPGGESDGVTLRTPLEALNLISARQLDWLVPGLIKEKVIALIRTLPKAFRVNFVPVPEVAADALGRMVFGHGALRDSLAAALHSLSGVSVPPDAWQEDLLPSHLRMNIAVVDASGNTISQGRDLAVLRRQLGARAAEQLAESGSHIFDRSVASTWDFGDLPERIDWERAGVRLHGYPVIFDERTHVRLGVLDDALSAHEASRAGVRRLFVLQVHDELAVHVEYLPAFDEAAELLSPLVNQESLKQQVIELAGDRAFLGDDPPVRTQVEFERRLRSRWNDLWPAASEAAEVVQQLAQAFHAVHLQLADADNPMWIEALSDIRGQLDDLFPPGFLLATPWPWLKRITAYLRGVQSRLRRLSAGGLMRDQKLTNEVRPHVERWRHRAAQHQETGRFDPSLREYRWMLEEFRLSLFAQEIGSIAPVSAKRLNRLFEQVR